VAERLPKGQEKFVDDDEFVYFYHLESFYRVPRKAYEAAFEEFKRQTDAEHDQVVGLGGLHIVGTERHEARRIDNQLRGRAGRQGDPGSSRFYLSLEDDLMRIFGSGRISGLMQRLGMDEGVPIEHGMVTRAIERAQKQVEAQNFSTRKHLLEYDDVMNKQRENVYTLRREILDGKIRLDDEEILDTRAYALMLGEQLVQGLVDTHAGAEEDPADWDLAALAQASSDLFGIDLPAIEALRLDEAPRTELAEKIYELAAARYEEKEKVVEIDPSILRRVERDIMLQIVDAQWKDHLYSLDHLKEGIGLRGYGQRDPLVEYKKESFTLFQAMKDRIDEEIVRYLWRLRPVVNEGGAPPPPRPAARPATPLTLSGGPSSAAAATASGAGGSMGFPPPGASAGPRPARTGGDDAPVKTFKREEPKIGRNDPCWCGSGKKFKKCHGA
jgi:preprotein translocase subunit SecA